MTWGVSLTTVDLSFVECFLIVVEEPDFVLTL